MGKVASSSALGRDVGPSEYKCLNFCNFHIPVGKHLILEFLISSISRFQRLHMESGMTSSVPDEMLKYLKRTRFSIFLGIKKQRPVFLSSTTRTNLYFYIAISSSNLCQEDSQARQPHQSLLQNDYLKAHNGWKKCMDGWHNGCKFDGICSWVKG